VAAPFLFTGRTPVLCTGLEREMYASIFFVLAAIFFAAGALRVKVIIFGNDIEWIAAGLCMVTIGLWLA